MANSPSTADQPTTAAPAPSSTSTQGTLQQGAPDAVSRRQRSAHQHAPGATSAATNAQNASAPAPAPPPPSASAAPPPPSNAAPTAKLSFRHWRPKLNRGGCNMSSDAVGRRAATTPDKAAPSPR